MKAYSKKFGIMNKIYIDSSIILDYIINKDPILLDLEVSYLNDILKNLRIKYNKTQQELAEVLGYKGKSGYSMLENGRVELTISKAKILSEYYKIDPKIFFEEQVQ